eukprot:XP_001706185.1 Hypothetical protein GL50803_32295 [Giardia lamblia ATCC 50803]
MLFCRGGGELAHLPDKVKNLCDSKLGLVNAFSCLLEACSNVRKRLCGPYAEGFNHGQHVVAGENSRANLFITLFLSISELLGGYLALLGQLGQFLI